MTDNYQCQVCKSFTFSEPGLSEICNVCGWEDEGIIENSTEPTYGPNGDLSLKDAIDNYSIYGKAFKD